MFIVSYICRLVPESVCMFALFVRVQCVCVQLAPRFVSTIRWINLIFPLRRWNDETLTNLKYATNINADVRPFVGRPFIQSISHWRSKPTDRPTDTKRKCKIALGLYLRDEKWRVNGFLWVCVCVFSMFIFPFFFFQWAHVCMWTQFPYWNFKCTRKTEMLSVYRHATHHRTWQIFRK